MVPTIFVQTACDLAVIFEDNPVPKGMDLIIAERWIGYF